MSSEATYTDMATQVELDAVAATATASIPLVQKAAANGVPSLDGSSRVVQSPKLHATDHAVGGTDVLTPAAIGAAPLASPALTGSPTVPTPGTDDNSTKAASTAYVIGQLSGAGDGTPAMDGTAGRGAAVHGARADHVHPTDSTRQAQSTDLTAIAALVASNDDVMQRKSGVWVARSMAQLKIDLALAKADVGLGNVDDTSDVNKPVSTATANALEAAWAISRQGADVFTVLTDTAQTNTAAVTGSVYGALARCEKAGTFTKFRFQLTTVGTSVTDFRVGLEVMTGAQAGQTRDSGDIHTTITTTPSVNEVSIGSSIALAKGDLLFLKLGSVGTVGPSFKNCLGGATGLLLPAWGNYPRGRTAVGWAGGGALPTVTVDGGSGSLPWIQLIP